MDYNEDHEPYVYLVETLVKREVQFSVSPGVVRHMDYAQLESPENASAYETEMKSRFQQVDTKHAKGI